RIGGRQQGRQRALRGQGEAPARRVPRRMLHRGGVPGLAQHTEAQGGGGHQHSSGTTGTATELSSANGLGSALRLVGTSGPSTAITPSSSGSCQGCSASTCAPSVAVDGST